MALNPEAVGQVTEAYTLEYDWKTVVLYALAIGARSSELDYVYEARGPQVYPTFGVVPGYPVLGELLASSGAELKSVVHAGQSLTLHGTIPPSGKFETRGRLTGIYDLKRFAQITFITETRLATSSAPHPLLTTEWTLLVLDGGGFGGPRPPKSSAPKAVEGPPLFSVSEPTRPEQALLSRLLGDYNPLHIDPEVARAVGFENGPILHGLCTFGYLGRVVINRLCQGEARRLKFLSAQFRKPVWPGENLGVTGLPSDDPSLVVLQALAGDRTDPVVSSAWAEITP